MIGSNSAGDYRKFNLFFLLLEGIAQSLIGQLPMGMSISHTYRTLLYLSAAIICLIIFPIEWGGWWEE